MPQEKQKPENKGANVNKSEGLKHRIYVTVATQDGRNITVPEEMAEKASKINFSKNQRKMTKEELRKFWDEEIPQLLKMFQENKILYRGEEKTLKEKKFK